VGSISHRTLRQVGSGRLSALGDQQSASECVRRTLPSVFGRPLFGVKQTCCSITFDWRNTMSAAEIGADPVPPNARSSFDPLHTSEWRGCELHQESRRLAQ
jgi:hypothetical protein